MSATCRCEAAKRSNWRPSGNVLVDDVVQQTDKGPWPYCFAIVTEVRAWGVIAEMYMADRTAPQRAPVRLEWESFEIVGPAVFVAKDVQS